MVGDDYEDDILAPHQFGFKTIWKPAIQIDGTQGVGPFERPLRFNYQNGQHVRPDAIIFSLKELPEVITRLENQALPATAQPLKHWQQR
jgi:FMN phosphatase YigB (HAD superfamily)